MNCGGGDQVISGRKRGVISHHAPNLKSIMVQTRSELKISPDVCGTINVLSLWGKVEIRQPEFIVTRTFDKDGHISGWMADVRLTDKWVAERVSLHNRTGNRQGRSIRLCWKIIRNVNGWAYSGALLLFNCLSFILLLICCLYHHKECDSVSKQATICKTLNTRLKMSDYIKVYIYFIITKRPIYSLIFKGVSLLSPW